MKSLVPPLPPNVIRFPASQRPSTPDHAHSGAPWRALTHDLVMSKARSGDLDPAIVEYLLAGCGVTP